MVKAGEASSRMKERGRKCLKRTLKLPYLQGLWKFLKSDSYMYGALLCPPGTVHGAPVSRLAEAVIRKEVRRKKKLRVSRMDRDEDLNQSGRKNEQVSQSNFSYVSIQHGVATPDGHERLNMRSSREGQGGENSETEDLSVVDGDEESCLEDDEAEQVVVKLVKKFGGRISKELGIDVDKGDDEVEKWFLAVALLNRSSSAMDVSCEILKKIFHSGISQISDTLNMDQAEVARILETAGYTNYSERTAARLHRLAVQLKTEHGGSICTMKRISESSELSRQLSGLFGLSQSSIRLFLRELRGVWLGVSSVLDRRAVNAARHLRLIGCKTDFSDERDVEAALTKLGMSHARHYRECSGGSRCEMLV